MTARSGLEDAGARCGVDGLRGIAGESTLTGSITTHGQSLPHRLIAASIFTAYRLPESPFQSTTELQGPFPQSPSHYNVIHVSILYGHHPISQQSLHQSGSLHQAAHVDAFADYLDMTN